MGFGNSGRADQSVFIRTFVVGRAERAAWGFCSATLEQEETLLSVGKHCQQRHIKKVCLPAASHMAFGPQHYPPAAFCSRNILRTL